MQQEKSKVEKNELKDETKTEVKNKEAKFSKEQLLKSNWYSHRRDVLTALLKDETEYSHSEVEKIIKNFFEKKVK